MFHTRLHRTVLAGLLAFAAASVHATSGNEEAEARRLESLKTVLGYHALPVEHPPCWHELAVAVARAEANIFAASKDADTKQIPEEYLSCRLH